jgi:hypothetical protein
MIPFMVSGGLVVAGVGGGGIGICGVFLLVRRTITMATAAPIATTTATMAIINNQFRPTIPMLNVCTLVSKSGRYSGYVIDKAV